MTDILTSILAGGVVLAVTILFVSIGEIYNERAGVLNLGLEAIITLAAFVGLWVTVETGDFLLGTLAAIVSGAGVGLIHSFTCVKMRVNQLIAGLLILALVAGLANFLYIIVIKKTVPLVTILPSIDIPFLSDIPVLGEILFQHNAFVYLAYFLAIVFGLILYKTTWGLKIRAVGENPEACDAAGINVNLIRHLCDIFSGAMAGLAGASLSLGFLGLFDSNIAGGRGWIAIIVVIFSRWSPFRAILGSMIFGIGFSIAANLIGSGLSDVGISAILIPVIMFLSAILIPVIMFLIGVAITKRLAGKKRWNDSFKTTLIVNLLWFVISFIISLIFSLVLPSAGWIGSIVVLIITIILGSIIASKVYEKEFGESLIFVIIIQVILFILTILIGIILGFILTSGIPYYFLQIMPYLVALVVIVLFRGTTKAPSALTVPYWRK